MYIHYFKTRNRIGNIGSATNHFYGRGLVDDD